MCDSTIAIDVSSVTITAGANWQPETPDEDIKQLTFKCWTIYGQIVAAFPSVRMLYIPNGSTSLFPINTYGSTVLPIEYRQYEATKLPFLSAQQNLGINFHGQPELLTLDNVYPFSKVIRMMGPALDLNIVGTSIQAPIIYPVRQSKAVNGFIAYRSLYGQYIPVARQMEVSGLIRLMWAYETAASKHKFLIAAKVYTLERDRNDRAGVDRPILKDWIYEHCIRFQIHSPEIHIVTHLIYCLETEGTQDYRNWLIYGDDWLRYTYVEWASTPTAVELLSRRDHDVSEFGEDTVNACYLSTIHFRVFDYATAFQHTHWNILAQGVFS